MLVSFIIIAYNAEKFLDKSLESLKKQDYPHKDIEVILVDSISTDGTRKVFEEFKKENEKDFKETIGNRISKIMKVSYVFQELTNLPEGYRVPEGRVKPWGTGHAVLSCL